jgi:hypothetical protein
MGAMNLEALTTTPCITPVSKRSKTATQTADWTLGCNSGPDSQSSADDEEIMSSSPSAMTVFNDAIEKLSQVATSADQVSPLTFQLKTTWDEAKEDEKEVCIDKAIEACNLVCAVIAPKAGQELFKSCCMSEEDTYGDLVPLMQAYSKAPTRNVKTQILSLYAYRYPVRTLQRIHEPYERLTEWQLRRARAHAKERGPGLLVEKSSFHRVRLPRAKLDHFIDFINRPYFYQDVAFGTRKLTLSCGEKMEMPNVIRKVTRSTMIKQYLQFCTEENVEPLSRATLFRILDVREASQQKSLSGLDNIAADGSAGFERLHGIVNELDQIGLDKLEADGLRKSLVNGKKYFKTEYQSHCQDNESKCADHCRKFGLSDPSDPDFQEQCVNQHVLRCPQCDDITSCLQKIRKIVEDGKTLSFYSKDHKDDLLYDIEKASDALDRWKGHIMRSVNQELAKQDIIANLDQSSCLLILDWAMKFLQLRFREKQSDWYGKRGLSWHISSVISRSQSDKIEVTSYAHLFDQCTQDWYAVSSIIEDIIKQLKVKNPKLQTVFLRSDEAGCYHNNFLIAALRDIAKRVGVTVQGYYYSEPQAGKDICDRILCPMKHAIRTYSNEGHDVLTAVHMRDALLQHPVKGTTAAVSTVNESQKTLSIKTIQDFSAYHSFSYEESGVRVWKCYGIGQGKNIPYDNIYVNHQGPTVLQTMESQGFYEPPAKRELNRNSEARKVTKSKTKLFECSVVGCEDAFETFAQLQLHLDVSKHNIGRVNQYDQIKRDWALKFSSVDVTNAKSSYSSDFNERQKSQESSTAGSRLQKGWALSKPRSNVRFSQKVKDYLTARFNLGERTGRKADPTQVVLDMRSAKDESNERLFTRTEWLTKIQIQGFFSRLAAARRKQQGLIGLSEDQEEDVLCLQEESERQNLMKLLNQQINVSHPICYDTYDLCERYHSETLNKFDVAMLKTICSHFEISFKSRDRKQALVDKISDMVNDCECTRASSGEL